MKGVITEVCNRLEFCVEIHAYSTYSREINSQYDIYFVDIEMPITNGFELVKRIEDPGKTIVYTTGIEDYVFSSFENNAYDFVRKRLLLTDVQRVLTRYVSEKRKKNNN
ncbi:MAG: response regulator [Solobacterium sp.]|nr:response regulator [Solobacterium sp.]